jgi:hypothetical protein
LSSNYLGSLSTVTPDQVKRANTTDTNSLADKEQSPLRSERELRVPALALSCTAAVPTTEPYRLKQRGAHYGALPPEIWRRRRSIHSYPSLVKTTDKEQSGQGDTKLPELPVRQLANPTPCKRWLRRRREKAQSCKHVSLPPKYLARRGKPKGGYL